MSGGRAKVIFSSGPMGSRAMTGGSAGVQAVRLRLCSKDRATPVRAASEYTQSSGPEGEDRMVGRLAVLLAAGFDSPAIFLRSELRTSLAP